MSYNRGWSWRAVRAADGASLENWWAEMSRGFESHALRSRYAPDADLVAGNDPALSRWHVAGCTGRFWLAPV